MSQFRLLQNGSREFSQFPRSSLFFIQPFVFPLLKLESLSQLQIEFSWKKISESWGTETLRVRWLSKATSSSSFISMIPVDGCCEQRSVLLNCLRRFSLSVGWEILSDDPVTCFCSRSGPGGYPMQRIMEKNAYPVFDRYPTRETAVSTIKHCDQEYLSQRSF